MYTYSVAYYYHDRYYYHQDYDYSSTSPHERAAPHGRIRGGGWLRTTGVNTNGAAAKVNMFDKLWKKVGPGTVRKITIGQREYPTNPSVEKHGICNDPISADPICPSPRDASLRGSVLR